MKKLFLVLAVFLLGFFMHAFIFPDFLSRTQNLEATKQILLGEQEKKTEASKSLTIATFKNGSFHPSKIWLDKGYYVGIRNDDEDKPMKLVSDVESLRTVRGYGLSEQLTAIMPKEGTYVVYEKNSQSQLVIVVRP